MLRVTIELVSAINGKTSVLGSAVIANDGTGDHQTGHYAATLLTWHDKPRAWRKCRVEGFPRRRRGPWDLLYRVLRSAGLDRRNA